MKVRLTKKLANHLDGIDVTDHVAGDVLELPPREAQLLIAERWAEPLGQPVLTFPIGPARLDLAAERTHIAARLSTDADESSGRLARTLERLREIREQLEQQRVVDRERRRAEDRIRDELHEARSRTVRKIR